MKPLYDPNQILNKMRADRDSDWPTRLMAAVKNRPVVAEGMIDADVLAPWRFDLSAAELRVVEAASRGLTCEMTADLLCIEPTTVRTHLRAARHRLRAKNTTHACCEAIRKGLIR